jgi:thiol-disulfide isomerase/thioredoxin
MLKGSTLLAKIAALLLAVAGGMTAAVADEVPLSGAVANFSRIDPPLPAPDDAFRDSAGNVLHLGDFRGKVVLLNLWATWCAPCRAEMPSLDRLQALLGGEGLQILPMSLDRGGGPTVAVFYGQHAITHLGVYLGGQGGLSASLKVSGLPTSFLIDRQGKIVGSLEGATQWDSPEAVALIRQYLKSESSAPATQPAAYRPGAGAQRTGAQRVGVGLSPL